VVRERSAGGRRRAAGLGRGLGRLLPALRGRLPRAQIDGSVKRKISRLHDSILPYVHHSLILARRLSRPGSRDAMKLDVQVVLTPRNPGFMSGSDGGHHSARPR